MFERDSLLPGDRTPWLLAIGDAYGRNTLLSKNQSPNGSPLCSRSLKNKNNGSGQGTSHRPSLDSGERESHLIGCDKRS